MSTTDTPSLQDVTKTAEIRLEDACNNAQDLPKYIAALRLFGVPALEQCGGDELRHAQLLVQEARSQAEYAITDLDRLSADLAVLVAAAAEGREW